MEKEQIRRRKQLVVVVTIIVMLSSYIIACVFCFGNLHRWLSYDDSSFSSITSSKPSLLLPRHRHHHNKHHHNDSFTIVQFADLHFGEEDHRSRFNDEQTKKVMKTVLDSEREVDLVVFSGDQISGWAIDTHQTKTLFFKEALSVVEEAEINYAVIWGNHDDQPYHLDTVAWFVWTIRISILLIAVIILLLLLLFFFFLSQDKKKVIIITLSSVFLILLMTTVSIMFLTTPSKNARNAISMQVISESNLSIGQAGPEGVHGHSNFYYHTHILNNDHSLLILFFDSGGGRLPEQIYDDQITWAESVFAFFPKSIISLAFMHIPLPEYNHRNKTKHCFGKHGESPSNVHYEHKSLYECLAHKKRTKAIFAGHDHANSWCCVSESGMPALCYGRHTGYSGDYYAAIDSTTAATKNRTNNDNKRGARVIKISSSSSSSNTDDGVQIKTWLRMEDGTTQESVILF